MNWSNWRLASALQLAVVLIVGSVAANPPAVGNPSSAPLPTLDSFQAHGVILLYHHISSVTPGSTSVAPRQFEEHLNFIEAEGFQVIALEHMLDRLRQGLLLPEKSVALTFDDGYLSVLEEAAPRLAARKFPFAVFVSTEQVGKGAAYLNWDQLREIQSMGGTVANHGQWHDSMALPKPDETDRAWRTRVSAEISFAQQQLVAKLGHAPAIYAYPYGEYSHALAEIVTELNLAGLAQHSGAVGAESNFSALPRHPFYTGADDLDRLKQRLYTQPLLLDASLPSGHITHEDWVDLQVEVSAGEYDAGRLGCFLQGEPITTHGSSTLRLRVGPLSAGRNVLICTAPLTDGAGYAWWSHLVMRR